MTSILLSLLAFGFLACQQGETGDEIKDRTTHSVFDSKKAEAWGADDYGMKKYVMALLKKGPNRDLDSTQTVELQQAHLKNITRMAEEGKLVLAGPFLWDGDIRGIYVFNVQTIEEAESLTNTDPAVQAGSLDMELVEWYGSAALMAVNEIHASIARKSIAGEKE